MKFYLKICFHFNFLTFRISLNFSHNHFKASTSRKTIIQITYPTSDTSCLGSGSNDSSPEVTNHYPGMTECGRNLNYGFIPRPMDKSVIISYQIYMNLLTNDSIINFNETKRKEEEQK